MRSERNLPGRSSSGGLSGTTGTSSSPGDDDDNDDDNDDYVVYIVYDVYDIKVWHVLCSAWYIRSFVVSLGSHLFCLVGL